MSTAPSSRAARRRILAVGPVDFKDDVRIETTHAESIFQALGAIAICPAGKPIEAVFIAPEHEDVDDLVHSADAIRRLDATVQIVLVSSGPVPPSIAGHFDRQVAPPISGANVEQLLDASPTSELASVPSPQTKPVAATPSAPLESQPVHTAPGPGPHNIGTLGDTDLVDLSIDVRVALYSIRFQCVCGGGGGGCPCRTASAGLRRPNRFGRH